MKTIGAIVSLLVLAVAIGCSGDGTSDQKTPEVGTSAPKGVKMGADGAAGGGGPSTDAKSSASDQ